MEEPALAVPFALRMLRRDRETYHNPWDVELCVRRIYTEAKLYVLPLQLGLKHLE
jgi:hypothetical protein